MAPPLPPPGVPAWAGFWPRPMALLLRMTLLRITHETPMLLIAAPLEQEPPSNVLPTTYTGLFWCWLSTRRPAPPRSGPLVSQRFLVKRVLTTLTRPPRTKTAPPPSVSPPFLD